MSEDMTKLFQMMKLELDKQTATITQSVTDSIMRNIDDKIKPILEENKYLKNEVQKLNDKARYLENKGKKNNLILHGIKEIENNRQELFNLIKEIMKGLNVDINSYEINNYYRLGKKHDEEKIYAPTETAKKETKNEFYKSLNEIMENLYKTIIVMGDFNSQIGQRRKNEDKIIGPYTIGKRNDNGQRLINYAAENNLTLEWDDYGININGVLLNHLRFADDLILISENPETLQKMIEQLVCESEKVGLSLNTNKTKLMTNYKKVPIKPYNTAKLEYHTVVCLKTSH
ncbi:uncharacterized protein LOC134201708 [Bombyx mori]|uniref:uncharacterized protein LOC134201708 n=1 Tax=Bombyx mori TaxID=7091 RepID=UPI002ECFB4A7